MSWPRWMAQGRCADDGADTADFYPDGRPDQQRIARIRAICWSCPVRRECLSWALRHEKYGFWGGFSEQERTSLIRTTCRSCRWTEDPVVLAMRPVDGPCADCRDRRPQHQPRVRRPVLGSLVDVEDREWFERQAAKVRQGVSA